MNKQNNLYVDLEEVPRIKENNRFSLNLKSSNARETTSFTIEL